MEPVLDSVPDAVDLLLEFCFCHWCLTIHSSYVLMKTKSQNRSLDEDQVQDDIT